MNDFKLNVLIVEDSLSFALELELLVQSIGYQVIGRADNAKKALAIIQEQEPDFILMDIDIKGDMNGLELGNKIRHLKIPILYITSFGTQEYYERAQSSNMIGYLVKPIDKLSLRSSIQLAFQNAYFEKTQQTEAEAMPAENYENFISKDCFFYKKKKTYHKVKIDDILFVRSNGNYCETITDNQIMFITRMPISKMEEILPSRKFMRLHRQYIIQISKIDMIDFQESIIKIKDDTLPIGRSKRKELEQMIQRMD